VTSAPIPPTGPVATAVPPGPGGMRKRARTTLAVRVTLLVIAVAVLVAGISSVVGILVVRRTLIDTTTQALSDQADLVAVQLAADPSPGAALAPISAILADQGIAVLTIGPDGKLTGSPRSALRAAREVGANRAVGGQSVSGSTTVGGKLRLVQARSSAAGGFALVTPADVAAATRQALERRLLAAVIAGSVAAVLIGLLIAHVVSRPLRRTAALARSMSRGARDVRAPVTGPREVAEVSTAVNDLADALQHSESRQREFLASVSHELRTPLAGIAGQAQALADGMVGPDEQAGVGRVIVAESARLERLVSDLLDLARLGADSFHLDVGPINVAALVIQMGRVWRVRCDARGVQLIIDVPTDAAQRPVVATDARRLRQVLDGLAENALRMVPPGRPLVLHVGREPSAGPLVSVVLQVRDGGPGLAADDYPVAFVQGVLHERYRGKRPGGAGLGLSLAHSLVQRLGGTIVASPAAEGGVAMTIRLPVAPDAFDPGPPEPGRPVGG